MRLALAVVAAVFVLGLPQRVVLLDVRMPGFDGYETCSRIRDELGRGVIVIALTGFGQEQDRERRFGPGSTRT